MIKTTYNGVFHDRTKHMKIEWHFFCHCDCVREGVIVMPFITSHLQVANFLMKSQSTTHLHYLVSKLVTISKSGTMKRSFQKYPSLQTKCQKVVSYLGTSIDL